MAIEAVLARVLRIRIIDKVFFVCERKAKEWLFGCQSCGNCVLSHVGFVCPMRCPKSLRNGPCGGAMEGTCEVDRSKRCVWDEVWESTVRLDRVAELTASYEIPPDWRLYGTSAWDNMVFGRLQGPSLFETMLKKGEPLTREVPRVFAQIVRGWWQAIAGHGWRRYEGRPPL